MSAPKLDDDDHQNQMVDVKVGCPLCVFFIFIGIAFYGLIFVYIIKKMW